MALAAAGLTDEALGGLVDALDFSDVAEDVGRLSAREFAHSLHIGRYPRLRETVKGTLGVAGVVASEPTIKAAGRAIYRHFRKRGYHRIKKSATKTAHPSLYVVSNGKHRRIGPTQPFTYPTSYYPRMGGAIRRGRRNTKKRRTHPYSRYKRSTYQKKIASAIPTRVLKGSHYSGKRIHIVKKILDGPAPTQQESGGSLGVVMLNTGSKGTPNGTFSCAWNFNLEQLPGYAQYTAIYQYYRILWVKMHFVPLQNSHLCADQGSSTNPLDTVTTDNSGSKLTGSCCWVVLAKDKVSDAIFSSSTDAYDHDTSIVHVFNDASELAVFCAPVNHDLIGVSGTEVPVPLRQSSWIPTSSTTVKHYGIRSYWSNVNNHTQVRVWCEMKVAFKDLKA